MNDIKYVILESEYNVLNSLYEYYNKQYIMESYYMEDGEPEVHVNSNNNNQQTKNPNIIKRFVEWCKRMINWIIQKISSLFKSPKASQPISQEEVSKLAATAADLKNRKSEITSIMASNSKHREEMQRSHAEFEQFLNKLQQAANIEYQETLNDVKSIATQIQENIKAAEADNDEVAIKFYQDLLKNLGVITSQVTTGAQPTENNTNQNTAEQERLVKDVWDHNWHEPKNMPDGTHDIWNYIKRLKFDDGVKYIKPFLKDINKKLKYLDGYSSSDPKVAQAISQTKAQLKYHGKELIEAVNETHTDADKTPLLDNPYKSKPGDSRFNPNNR